MAPSSISSSKPESPLRKIIATLVVLCVVMILLDQSIEYIFDNVLHYAPSIIPNTIARAGIDRFWKLLDSEAPLVVFSGSSTMAAAFSPHKFDEQVAAQSPSAITSVNMSIVASRPLLISALSKNIIFPNHPQIFFYGIELRALNEDNDLSIPADSPLGYTLRQDSNVTRTAFVSLLRYSGFVRYRDILQEWIATGQSTNYSLMKDDSGFIISIDVLKGQEEKFVGARWPFPKVSAVQHEALKAIAHNCKDYNVPCVFIGMPMSQESYKYILPQENERYQKELETIVKDTQIPLWNFDTPECRTLLDNRYFRDLNHLNINGANIFSSMMASLYLTYVKNSPVHTDTQITCVKMLKP